MPYTYTIYATDTLTGKIQQFGSSPDRSDAYDMLYEIEEAYTSGTIGEPIYANFVVECELDA